MKIVVTGGAGRLGPFLIGELAERGHGVLCLDTSQPGRNICPTLAVDLRDTSALFPALKGADAVVHLARIRFPYTSKGFNPLSGLWETPEVSADAERFSHNVTITYNILAAAFEAGVKKFVCGSSLAIYGFYYPLRAISPGYLPIDEDHPLRPQDPYGRSKEPLCRGTGALWSYVDVQDAAVACRLAVEKNFSGHKTFNICAPQTIMEEDTLDLVKRYLPLVRLAKESMTKNWSGYDTARAESILRFRATHLLKH